MADMCDTKVDSSRLGGVKNNPFLRNKSMEKSYVKKRRQSRGLNSIGKGKISSILSKWNQQIQESNSYTATIERQRPSKKAYTTTERQAINYLSKEKQQITDSQKVSPEPMNVMQPIIDDIDRKLDSSRNELSKYMQNNAMLIDKNIMLQSQIKELEATNDKLHETQKELAAKAQVFGANANILELKQKLELLQAEHESQCNMNKGNEEREALLKSLKEKIEQNEAEIIQFSKMKNEEINALIKENNVKNEEMNKYVQSVKDMHTQIEAERAKSSKLEKILSNNGTNKDNGNDDDEVGVLNEKIESLVKDKDEKILQLNESLKRIESKLSDSQSVIKELKQTNDELNRNNEELIMQNAELNEKKSKIAEMMVKIEEMEKENEKLRNEQNAEDNEYVDVGQASDREEIE